MFNEIKVTRSSLPPFDNLLLLSWNLRLRDPLRKASYEGKGIHTFDTKFKLINEADCLRMLDKPKFSINSEVSVILL